MKKSEALKRWDNLEPNQNPLEVMEPITYKSKGSKFGACGIRIDGSPEFIDAVLSNLKELLDGENNITRLELARNEVKAVEINGKVKSYDNAVDNPESCYIRLHERGRDAKAMNVVFNVHGKRK